MQAQWIELSSQEGAVRPAGVYASPRGGSRRRPPSREHAARTSMGPSRVNSLVPRRRIVRDCMPGVRERASAGRALRGRGPRGRAVLVSGAGAAQGQRAAGGARQQDGAHRGLTILLSAKSVILRIVNRLSRVVRLALNLLRRAAPAQRRPRTRRALSTPPPRRRPCDRRAAKRLTPSPQAALSGRRKERWWCEDPQGARGRGSADGKD